MMLYIIGWVANGSSASLWPWRRYEMRSMKISRLNFVRYSTAILAANATASGKAITRIAGRLFEGLAQLLFGAGCRPCRQWHKRVDPSPGIGTSAEKEIDELSSLHRLEVESGQCECMAQTQRFQQNEPWLCTADLQVCKKLPVCSIRKRKWVYDRRNLRPLFQR